ncbi:hypothetical protein [Thermoflexus sp.]|uniref:hypothetical protein n=1 Tax=Thermoflexus sp. TaxID=1969742 RepID=UPI00176E3F70|nr:hypothetical protein [Thermoflexus sp.]
MAIPQGRSNPSAGPAFIGRVIESSARTFLVGCRLTAEDIPAFGSFVQTARGETTIIGIIYDLILEGDELTRMVALQDVPPQEIQQDMIENRNIPVQIGVLTLGYMRDRFTYYGIPHQPPALLEPVYTCLPAQIQRFTEQPDFIRTLVEAREASDDVLAAVVRAAAAIRPGPHQRDFLIQVGQELVRLLADEPTRLGQVLRRIRMAVEAPG